MFTTAFIMSGIIVILIALFVVISILAIAISSRKYNLKELLYIAIVLSIYILQISLYIPEIKNYDLWQIQNVSEFIVKVQCHVNKENLPKFIYLTLFNLLQYSAASFVITGLSRRKFKSVVVRCTITYLPLIAILLFLKISDICSGSDIDCFVIVELYIGSAIGYVSSKKLHQKKGKKYDNT